MASRSEAKRAKTHLGARLAGRRWLRGIGLEGSGDQYRVRVNVDAITPDVHEAIPRDLDGVEVTVASVGDLSSLPADD